jgi:hypothetical protein
LATRFFYAATPKIYSCVDIFQIGIDVYNLKMLFNWRHVFFAQRHLKHFLALTFLIGINSLSFQKIICNCRQFCFIDNQKNIIVCRHVCFQQRQFIKFKIAFQHRQQLNTQYQPFCILYFSHRTFFNSILCLPTFGTFAFASTANPNTRQNQKSQISCAQNSLLKIK